jgi:hypothetical protein
MMSNGYTTPWNQLQQNQQQWGGWLPEAAGMFIPGLATQPWYQQAMSQRGAGRMQGVQQAQYGDTAADIQRMYGFQGQQESLAGRVGGLANQMDAYNDQLYRPGVASARYGSAMNPISQGYGQLPRQYGGQARGIYGDFQQGAAGIGQGYQQRLNTGMGMISGYGRQGAADINRGFGALGSTQQANLQARGLGGTTISSDVMRGNEMERSAEMRRHGEDVSRMQTGLYSDLSGEALRSRADLLRYGTDVRSRAAEFGAGLSLSSLAAQEGIAQGGLDYRDQAAQNWMANKWGYGMAPIQSQWDAAQSGINATQGINRVGPQPYPPMGYGY